MRSSTTRLLAGALLLAAACGDSPSGAERADQVAFTVIKQDSLQVHVINADGTGMQRVDTLDLAYDPTWSPDGRTLAFAGVHAGRRGLYTARVDGSQHRFLQAGLVTSPVWHPDGERILYVDGIPSSGTTRIVSVNSRGEDLRILFTGGSYSEIAVSRDGARIAWSTDRRDICVASLRGGAATCFEVDGDYPAWSPDGRIAFTGFVQDGLNRDIYLMDPDGRNVTRFTRGPETDWGIEWSPDGRRVLVERQRAQADHGFGLDIGDAAGGGLRPLTPFSIAATTPAWRP